LARTDYGLETNDRLSIQKHMRKQGAVGIDSWAFLFELMMMMAALGPTPDNIIQVPTEPGMQGDDGEQSGPTSTSGKNFHNFYIEHNKRFPNYD